MRIEVLGCSGGIGPGLRTTSLMLDGHSLIDAGTEAFSLAPSSFLVARNGRPVSLTLEPLRQALDERQAA